MQDKIRMESHKLIYHPKAVAQWLEGKNIYPIELEVSLTNACNHRCVFCALDYTGYQPVYMDSRKLLDNLKEIAPKGLKSIIYAGEGEPLLHKDAPEVICRTKSYGIDVAMSTNGVLFSREIISSCLKHLTWVRFSTAAINDKTYQSIHQCKQGDLAKALNHMEEAVRVKRDQKLKTTIGVQLLLLEENKDEVILMAQRMKEIGVDYFTVKPFSHHPMSHNLIQVNYNEMIQIGNELKAFEDENFKVYFRENSMKKLQCERGYDKCYALPFMTYLDSLGNLWPCIAFMGKKQLSYGNILDNKFVDIWEGEQRKKVIEYFNNMDLKENCRELCRLDEMNRYLYELKNASDHVNFI